MTMIRCVTCGGTFGAGLVHICPGAGPGVVNFGELGEDPETTERRRVATLGDRGPVDTHPSRGAMEIAAQAEAQRAVGTVLRAEMGGVRQALADLQRDIKANSEMLHMVDIPLEQVANSHERATQSFERLRAETADVSARLAGVEQVIDTAGLRRAQDGAEARFTRLADLLEKVIEELRVLQGGALEAARAKLMHKPVHKRRVARKKGRRK